jgi:ribosome-interacting GTPase 1
VPANLPPDYYAAESALRAATTPQARLEALERMLAVMPHHKGTDHLRAELRVAHGYELRDRDIIELHAS